VVVTLAAVAVLSPTLRPASAKPADPNSPKGSFSGTYISDDETLSGPIKLSITSVKNSPVAGTLQVKGKLTIGSKVKNKPYTGTYMVADRSIVGGTLVPRGYAGSFSGTLSQDGKTLTGEWGYNTIPQDSDQHQGTATMSRR
jgi:hypothetical protein